MALTTYSELKTAIGTWLNRSDLTTDAADFISLAEAKLRRDPRTKRLQTATLSASAEDVSLPSDFRSIVGLYHDSDAHRFEIQIVSPDELINLKRIYGNTGRPAYGAIVNTFPGSETIRFSPVPDQTYSLKMIYDWRPPALSDSNTTNWLLTNHPDIYLFGALLEAAPYLKDDGRVVLWQSKYEEALDQLHVDAEREQWGGTVVAKPARPIG